MSWKSLSVFVLVQLGIGVLPVSRADDWPQWRGPGGQGVSRAVDVPIRWSEGENVAWKTPIRGLGWSSPVILGDQIWLTTAETVPANKAEEDARRKATTNNQPLEFVGKVMLRAVCIDKRSGEIVKDILVMTDDNPDPIHAENSYATPTPVIEGERLYCHYGTHGTGCVDTTTGQVLWTNQELRINHENGPGSSPVVWGDLVMFHCDGSNVQYVAAINKHSGEVAWRVDRTGELNGNPQLRKAYATPLSVEIDGEAQLMSPGADWIYSYDPVTGKENWKLSYGQLGFSNASRPVFHDGILYLCTGFMKSRMLAIDCTHPNEPQQLWTFAKQVSAVSSPIVVDGRLYFISDRGVATCLDAKTGEPKWQSRVGGNHWSSPIYVDGFIVFSSKEGVSTVVRAADDFEIVSRNQLDGTIMASVAAVDSAMFIRTDKAVYRIE